MTFLIIIIGQFQSISYAVTYVLVDSNMNTHLETDIAVLLLAILLLPVLLVAGVDKLLALVQAGNVVNNAALGRLLLGGRRGRRDDGQCQDYETAHGGVMQGLLRAALLFKRKSVYAVGIAHII